MSSDNVKVTRTEITLAILDSQLSTLLTAAGYASDNDGPLQITKAEKARLKKLRRQIVKLRKDRLKELLQAERSLTQDLSEVRKAIEDVFDLVSRDEMLDKAKKIEGQIDLKKMAEKAG